MPRVSTAFFGLGVLYVLCGMFWGMQMGESNDFAMAPAHAHLNLLGWVTMALYGTFYALTRDSFSPRLAWINFAFAALSVPVMIPTLALYLRSADAGYIPVLVVGEVLAVAGMITFGISVIREWRRASA